MANISQVRQTPALSLKLTQSLIDPLNRVYRLRVAAYLCKKLVTVPVTANEITVAHTLVGVSAAFMIYHEQYLLAVLAYEVRTILDCLDGLLARAKNQTSAMGRTLDTIGDAITFNSLMLAGALRLIQDYRNYNAALITLGVFIFAFVTANSGTVYQLMKRKLGSIICKEVDLVELGWREHYMNLKNGQGGLIDRFGFWLDSVTIRIVSVEWYAKVLKRKDSSDWEAKAVNEAALMNELACITRKGEFRQAVKATAYVGDGNILSVLSICLLLLSVFHNDFFPFVHPVLVAFSAAFFYALLSLIIGLYYLQRFLHGVHKE